MSDHEITPEDLELHEQAMATAMRFRQVESELGELIDRLYEQRLGRGGAMIDDLDEDLAAIRFSRRGDD